MDLQSCLFFPLPTLPAPLGPQDISAQPASMSHMDCGHCVGRETQSVCLLGWGTAAESDP